MSTPVLTVLKFCLVAVMWLFFIRVLRAVWVEIRSGQAPEPGPPRAPAPPTREQPARPATRSRKGPVALRVLEPAEWTGRRFEIADRATVGRAPGNTIALEPDSYVSASHARLWTDDGHLWVEDTGSTNGTFVNSSQINAPVELRKGDRVQFGQTVMEVQG